MTKLHPAPRGVAVLLAALLAVALPGACNGGFLGQAEPPLPERITVDTQALEAETAPPLVSVPEAAPPVTPPAERAELERALRADRERARAEREGEGHSAITVNLDALPAAAGATAGAGAPAGVPSTGVPEGMIGVIHFAHGSAALDGRDREILRQVARLQRERGGSLLLVGHASSRSAPLDPQRHAEANLRMSQRRAEAVAAALREAGVPAAALRAEAVGDRGRVYHEFMATGEAGNRRVEIYLQP